jgi:hypothetical protein
MSKFAVSLCAAVVMGAGAAGTALAQAVTVLPSSLVRVRADNHFGITKDQVFNPPALGGSSHSISDTEMGTAAIATNSATYDFSVTGSGAVFDIRTTQSHSAGSTGNLTEGFIQFTTTEPFVYEVNGRLGGTSPDAGDAIQLRAFLRQFVSPFTTMYLEDETRVAMVSVLYVNQGDDTGGTAGSSFNQSGPGVGLLPPGTYEFAYELESNDRDVDQAAAASATGDVRLTLRKPVPPTTLNAVLTGPALALSWPHSPDAQTYFLSAGTASGASNLFAGVIGNITALQASLPPGTYFVRVASVLQGLVGPPSSEVTFTVGPLSCTAPPPTPAVHTVPTGGSTADLRWTSSPGATSYALDAGTVSGGVDLASVDVGSRTFFTVEIPPLTYFTRIRAVNACGSSAPSNEVSFTTCTAPIAPVLGFSRAGSLVRLDWTSSVGAVSYVLHVGTAPGASDIFAGALGNISTLTFPNTVLPAGIYYIRVVAVGACGPASAPSAEIALTLP